MTSTTCNLVREAVMDNGPDAFAEAPELGAHVLECGECVAFIEALSEVDAALVTMPKLDAPDTFVERVLVAAKEPRPATERGPRPPHRSRRVMRILLATGTTLSILVVGLSLTTMPMMDRAGALDVTTAPDGAKVVIDSERREAPPPAPQGGEGKAEMIARVESGRYKIELEKEGFDGSEKRIDLGARDLSATVEPALAYDSNAEPAKLPEALPVTSPAFVPARGEPVNERANGPITGQTLDADGTLDRQLEVDHLSQKAAETGVGGKDAVDTSNVAPGNLGWAATELLAERSQIDGLTFRDAEGYWSNTYIPGDPAYRFLGAMLTGDGIEDLAQPYPQPFDAPSSSAIALTMASDRASVEGKTRALVQIGLQGAPRHGRRRPSMNIGLVVDASGEVSVETAKKIRAIVTEIAKAKETGDRMSLTVAGKPGAMIVEPGRFEYGAVAVALQQVLVELPRSDLPSLSMSEAMVRAVENVAADGDAADAQPLGASAVLVITGRSLGLEVQKLMDIAHQSAVAGISVGAIGVGDAVVGELDRIALSGQGNRRLMADASEAETLVDRELASVSRVVARALRIRIRLAPGVKLVDVLGSRRLDTAEATRVKEAERSIDLRLSKSLGIEADRGDDEDGIQIVIPSYYTGDQHVILLDVVVSGPGPVADVQVRYKDLVYLKNSVARARLELTRGRKEPGPLQIAVLENLVSRRVADSLARASEALEAGDPSGAKQIIDTTRALLASLQRQIPSFGKNPDIRRDQTMLDAYRAALDPPEASGQLIHSLKFASKAKVLPPIPSTY